MFLKLCRARRQVFESLQMIRRQARHGASYPAGGLVDHVAMSLPERGGGLRIGCDERLRGEKTASARVGTLIRLRSVARRRARSVDDQGVSQFAPRQQSLFPAHGLLTCRAVRSSLDNSRKTPGIVRANIGRRLAALQASTGVAMEEPGRIRRHEGRSTKPWLHRVHGPGHDPEHKTRVLMSQSAFSRVGCHQR